jgi:hypothetical protein
LIVDAKLPLDHYLALIQGFYFIDIVLDGHQKLIGFEKACHRVNTDDNEKHK